MKPGITFHQRTRRSHRASWIPSFPNPADFRFDYFKLMADSPDGLARPRGRSPRKVAVIGAGAAGMTVARELHRCGFEVTIYEATDRIGGRLYTHPNPNGNSQAAMEMGAMRMPFFSEPNADNSLLGYYINAEATAAGHGPILTPFPNPGSAPGGTGIYINGGHGTDLGSRKPKLIDWPAGEAPSDPELQKLTRKVSRFGKNFSIPANAYYHQDSDVWPTLWRKMVGHYTNMTFQDLVLAKAMPAKKIRAKIADPRTFDGDLGGFGMNAKQADLLYTIGTGDGSWGAFYSIGALWFLRCTFFGFDSNLQTVEGLSDPQDLPHYDSPVKDTAGESLTPPLYQGIQSLPEYLYYVPAPGAASSLYEGARLFVGRGVSSLTKIGRKIVVEHGPKGGRARKETFDYVVVTASQWAAQMSIRFKGFSERELPQQKLTTEHIQHNISSCKLFFPLKKRYWEEKGNRIPQILVTDTYIQDVYALSWRSREKDRGVLLASYTWEDDSLKLLPFDDDALAKLVLSKLEEITTTTVGQNITRYVDKSKPVTLQWISQPSYVGCAKLYRSRNEDSNMLDLAYNEAYSKRSRLYFAGENYGVEGGWTEPALRSGLDCVMRLLHNVRARFRAPGFRYAADYPSWDYEKP